MEQLILKNVSLIPSLTLVHCTRECFRVEQTGDRVTMPLAAVVVVVVVSHIQRIGCQPEKNYFTRWPIPLVVC